ncbi:MAG: hypothetical protein AAF456_04000 [Planctomycetota bacterium]
MHKHLLCALILSICFPCASRALAEGDITVQKTGVDLLVSGQNNSNQSFAIVPGNVAAQVIFYRLDEKTTFNGQPFLVVDGFTGDMAMSLGTGNKVVVFSEGDEEYLTFHGDLQIDSIGSDSVGLIFDTVWVNGDTEISTRHGNDSLITIGTTFAGRLSINTFQGDDAVYIGGDTGIMGPVEINSHAGRDYILWFSATANGFVNVDAGGGNDKVAFYYAGFGFLNVHGQAGIDLLEFYRPQQQFYLFQRRSIEDFYRGNQVGGFPAISDEAQEDIPEFAFLIFVYQWLQLGS